MNFDCPGCQAKYQIADEKVASKAVKMKCRKCATPILISSLGARRALGASEGRPMTMPPGMSVPPPRSLAPPSMPRRRSLPARPATASLSPTAASLDVSSSLSVPKSLAEEAPVPPLSRRPAVPSRGPLPKASLPPSRAALHPASAESASFEAPSPLSPSAKPASASAPHAPEPHVNGKDRPSATSLSPQSLSPHMEGLEVKIQESEEPNPPSLRRMASKMPMVMWHVGVDGTVLGPMTRTELAERCQKGEVTKGALVWKDGMSGWAPIENVDDLKELVLPLEKKSGVAARALMGLHGSADIAPAPDFALPLSNGGGVGSIHMPVALAPAAGAPRRDSLWARVEARAPKRSHIAFLAVAAAVFGGAISFIVFGGQDTKIIEKRVEVRVKDEVAPADNVPPPPAVDDSPSPVASSVVSPTKANGTTSKAADTHAAPVVDTKGTGLKGLSGLSGLGSTGPQAGPTPGAGAGASQALDSGQIESTVSRYRNSVKRGCWQPALDARDKSAPSSARVNVSITVAASGSVKNVSSSGDPPGYRGLASCIQSRVSTWSFPPSSGSTTVNVPFVFATQ